MSGARSFLAELVYPKRCFLCGEVVLPRQQLCSQCGQEAPYILPPVCPLCGRGEDACICGGRRRLFERCVSPFYHDGVVKQGVSALKNSGYKETVAGFAAEMGEMVRREYGGIPFALVTSVPLHPSDRRARGFDQAALLARELAQQIGVPYAATLRKLVRTKPQKELNALERSGNLLGVFDAMDPAVLQDATVLLVDDVITTGATLDECAKMLKIYGAAQVYAVTAAAAVRKNEDEGKES